MWSALIKRYWLVCIFKETPAETPCSWFLLIMIAGFYDVLVMLQWMIAEVGEASSFRGGFFIVTLLIFSYALYTYALLAIYHMRNRFIQTLSCLYVGHAVVHLFALPLLISSLWLSSVGMSEPFLRLISMIYLVATLMLTVWQFMVSVHIYKHALGVDYLAAVLASFGLLATNILTLSFWR